MQKFKVHNQEITINENSTHIKITYTPLSLGEGAGGEVIHPPHEHRFKFNLLKFTGWDELKHKDYATYLWLGRLEYQIKMQGKQLTLEL